MDEGLQHRLDGGNEPVQMRGSIVEAHSLFANIAWREEHSSGELT